MRAPRVCSVFFVLLVVSLTSVSAFAQVKPTPEQKELNAHAYAAMKEGDVDTAIADYLHSIEIADLNVTYLNLGRAYQKAGQCHDAWAAYESVTDAPKVEKPAPEVIERTLERYVTELEGQCPTKVRVTCADEEAKFSVDDGHQYACPGELVVDPGEHLVRAHHRGGSKLETVEVLPGRVVDVSFDAVEPREAEDDEAARTISPPVEEQPPEATIDTSTSPRVEWTAWAAIGGGLLLGATALLLDGAIVPLWPPYAHDFVLGPKDFVPTVGYLLSVGALAYGIWDLLDGGER